MNLKILPLKCYDIIIGMDWLENHSPMQVHWSEKWISFQHLGQQVTIQGLTSNTSRLEKLSATQLQALEQNDDIWCVGAVSASSRTTEF